MLNLRKLSCQQQIFRYFYFCAYRPTRPNEQVFCFDNFLLLLRRYFKRQEELTFAETDNWKLNPFNRTLIFAGEKLDSLPKVVEIQIFCYSSKAVTI
jgi:hypothetical protein